MPYQNHFSNEWERKAYKEGYEAGLANRYRNSYSGAPGGLGNIDLARTAAYDEGYEDGKADRYR